MTIKHFNVCLFSIQLSLCASCVMNMLPWITNATWSAIRSPSRRPNTMPTSKCLETINLFLWKGLYLLVYIIHLLAFTNTCWPLGYSKLHSCAHSFRNKFIYWGHFVSDAMKTLHLERLGFFFILPVGEGILQCWTPSHTHSTLRASCDPPIKSNVTIWPSAQKGYRPLL